MDWQTAVRPNLPKIKEEVYGNLCQYPIAQQHFQPQQIKLLAESAVDDFFNNATSQPHFIQCCEVLPQQLPRYVEAIAFVNRDKTPQENMLIAQSNDAAVYMRYAKQYVQMVTSLKYEHYDFLVRFYNQVKDFCNNRSVEEIANHFEAQKRTQQMQQQQQQQNMYNYQDMNAYNNQYNYNQPQMNYQMQQSQQIYQQSIQIKEQLITRHATLKAEMEKICQSLEPHHLNGQERIELERLRGRTNANNETLYYYTNMDLIAIQPFQLIAIEIMPTLTMENIQTPNLLTANPPFILYHHVYYRKGHQGEQLKSHATRIPLRETHYKMNPEALLKEWAAHMCLYARFEQEVKMLFDRYGLNVVGTLECQYANQAHKLATIIIHNQCYPTFRMEVGVIKERQTWEKALEHLRTDQASINIGDITYPIIDHDFIGRAPGSTHGYHKVKNNVMPLLADRNASAIKVLETWLASAAEHLF